MIWGYQYFWKHPNVDVTEVSYCVWVPPLSSAVSRTAWTWSQHLTTAGAAVNKCYQPRHRACHTFGNPKSSKCLTGNLRIWRLRVPTTSSTYHHQLQAPCKQMPCVFCLLSSPWPHWRKPLAPQETGQSLKLHSTKPTNCLHPDNMFKYPNLMTNQRKSDVSWNLQS